MNHDYSRCLIDFTTCPKGVKLTDHFPELGAFKEFQEAPNENYIKIAIATADIESPMVKIKDRETMLNTLFDFLNIDKKKEPELYKDILDYKDSFYLNCFGRYLQILHDVDWTEYQTTKQTHDVLTMEASKKQGDEDIDKFVARKVKLQGHLKSVGKDLKALEAKIFPDSRAAREVALNESKLIKTYAEAYAQENSHI